ncbi:PmoA family protein [Rhodonellum sp.]|uniref:DUF6807 domain-containing protein n=1 Tax=Rhodonellum sp. TaxID=2231180 RepID=UPI00271ED1B8|nr:PmoA family protein [Rhodonellum sp.]MDO9552786.1 PmoA family protein [Rhodonellum sp.]
MKQLSPIILLALLALFSCQKPLVRVKIEAGEIDRIGIPVHFEIPSGLDPNSTYVLEDMASGKLYSPQISEGQMSIFLDRLQANQTLTLELKKGTESNSGGLDLRETEGKIQILNAGNEVLTYHPTFAYPPDGQSESYKKSGFIHPVKSPEGQILTDDFPMGHLHQHAIYNAWAKTRFKGKKVDFWNQLDSLGTVSHKQTISQKSGTAYAELVAMLSHISLIDGEALEETWEIKVYPSKGFHLFDILSTQVNTSNDTLFMDKYIYGGMAFRGSKAWNPDDSLQYQNPWEITTDQGHTLAQANNQKAQWVTSSGNIDGKATGITIFGFPENFKYPQAIRVHPTMPYWVYSPVIEEGFFLAPGERYSSKFRYLVFDGKPDLDQIQQIQNTILHPIHILVNP